MPVILRPITASETESIVTMLRDAEEGEERIRAAVLDTANTSYGAFDGETLVGAEDTDNFEDLHWASLFSPFRLNLVVIWTWNMILS